MDFFSDELITKEEIVDMHVINERAENASSIPSIQHSRRSNHTVGLFEDAIAPNTLFLQRYHDASRARKRAPAHSLGTGQGLNIKSCIILPPLLCSTCHSPEIV